MKETWKDIEGYEGFYQISNLGRARSLERVTTTEKGIERRIKPRIMKIHVDRKGKGYTRLNVSVNGKAKSLLVHRLVATAFIPNPENHPLVNHIDVNPENNHVDNLEWCTYSHNNTRAGAQDKRVKKVQKAIQRVSIDGEVQATYISAKHAEDESNRKYKRSGICHALKGNIKVYKGHTWQYVDQN